MTTATNDLLLTHLRGDALARVVNRQAKPPTSHGDFKLMDRVRITARISKSPVTDTNQNCERLHVGYQPYRWGPEKDLIRYPFSPPIKGWYVGHCYKGVTKRVHLYRILVLKRTSHAARTIHVLPEDVEHTGGGTRV